MIYRIIGTIRKKGVYQNANYDNIMIHCVCEPELTDKLNDDQDGNLTEVFKVKTSLFPVDCGVGSAIMPMYDRYGRICEIRIVE